MSKWPKFLVISGVILILNGLFMDTSVNTGFGQIHNIGLMQRSQNLILLGGILLLGGLIWNASKTKTHSEEEKGESEEVDHWVEEFKEKIKTNRETNKERWRVIIASIPRDRLALRVFIGLATGLMSFVVVLSLGGAYQISFIGFMLAFVLFLAVSWLTIKRGDVYKSALPLLILLILGFLILWFGVLINALMSVGGEIAFVILIVFISFVPLLASHFLFRKYNTGLNSQYFLKFLLVFISSVAVMAFGASLLFNN